MGRPPGYQWQPLGLDADPVPGDPPAIRAEAGHLAAVARTIDGQITAMRKIASDDTETGQHAEKIHAAALALAGSLQAVGTRYIRVSSALSGWVAELEQAQSLSIRALNEAEAPYARLSQPVILPAGPALTAAQQQEVAGDHASVQRAQDQLDAAKALLARVITARDTQGALYAAKINQASHDGLADHESLWGDITGGFDHAVHDVSWELKDVCTVLEVAATVAGIAAFVIAQFIPGLDVAVDALVLGAFLATGVAAGGRAALAAAGNGSWRDFAFDAVALVSFGVGRAAGLVAKEALPAAEAAAKSAYTSELITDIAAGGPRGAMLSKLAAEVGTDSVQMASRVAEFAPSLANGAELSGFFKVMAHLGAFGAEESSYARLIWFGTRFTALEADLSQYAALSKTMLGVAGVSAGAGAGSGIAGSVLGGIELDWGREPVVKVDIPPVYRWYGTHLWAPAGG